jgi:hypothetical protein
LDWADATFVITNNDGQYRALAVSPGLDGVAELAVVKQQGNSIRFRVVTGETAGDTYRFTATRDPSQLKLVAMEEGMTKPAHAVVKKVSDSTASPTASPVPWSDPFVGTWRMKTGDRPVFVISGIDDMYTVVQGTRGSNHYLALGSFVQEGDNQLTATIAAPNEGRMTLTVLTPQIMQLHFLETGKTEPLITTLAKRSDSTATPIPVP